jgi:peptide/nickel transport system substrate-binding protein
MFETSALNLEDAGINLALGTGPFVFSAWDAGSKVVLERNEAYWLDPALPKLDSVVVSIVPDTQAAIGGFINGDYDTLAIFTSGDMAQVAQAEDDGAAITVYQPDQVGSVEWLWLNQSDNGDVATPHPVIGDIAIRQAMDAAIDRQAIIDEVLAGFGELSGSFLYAGFGEVRTEPTEFDPDRARQILDDAGWVEGDDGVRVKDGVRASVRYQTIAGDQVRSLYQQIIQQNLAEVGIETVIDNVPSNSLFDSRDEGGLLANGDFDIVMTRDGFYSDPAVWVDVFDTAHIPAAGQTGISYAHWSNAEYDELAQKAATTMDSEERIAILKEIDEMFTSQILAIPLYASGVYYPFSTGIQNVSVDYWDGPWATQSSANWALSS